MSLPKNSPPPTLPELLDACAAKPIPERARIVRRLAATHADLFALQFFQHLLNRPFGPMHREIIQLHEQAAANPPIHTRPARRLAIAAPRGAAKTTLKSLILPLHAILYRHERYIAILSATLKQAAQRLANIKAEIETNAPLRRAFPTEVRKRAQWNRKGININNVQVDIFSAGTELRGISYRQWRPTLVLLDDIEDSKNVQNPEQRQRLLEWYNEVIENIGDTYTAIEIVGTILHPDSLLANLIQRPDFQRRIYRSVIHFAHRNDLWEQWRDLYTDLEDPHRTQTARRFYQANRPTMLQGAAVLWPEKEDYYELMTQMVTRGRAAFYKEKQNQPQDAQETFFEIQRARTFRIQRDRLAFDNP